MSSNTLMSPIQTKSKPTGSRTDAGRADSGRTYAGQSQAERKQQRRQQFLLAGLNLFGTVGFRQCTVRGICREAKLTDRYFYAEFGRIEALLTAVYEDCMIRIRNQVIQSLANSTGSDPQVLIRKALTAFYEAMQDPRVARVCMVELEGVSPEVDDLYHGYIESFADILLQFMHSQVPDWRYSDSQAKIMGIAMVGAMRQAATYGLRHPSRVSKADLIDISSRLFIGVFNEIKTS